MIASSCLSQKKTAQDHRNGPHHCLWEPPTTDAAAAATALAVTKLDINKSK